MSKYDFGCTLCTHYSNLGSRPSHNAVCTEPFRAHGDIRSAICLANYNRDFGNCGGRIGKQQLGSMPDDASPPRLHPWQKSRPVNKRQQWTVKCMAEADKSSGLIRSIHVQRACHDTWLVGNDPDGAPLQPSEAD